MHPLKTTRRTFVTHTAALGLTLPAALLRLVRAAPANEKLNLACVGTANRAAADIRGVAGEPMELYDLAADERERNDVAGEHPERVAEFRELFDEARSPSEHWSLPEE